MAAPKGNKFWKERKKHGRNPVFETAEDLRNACYEYFDWVDENPLYEAKMVQFQGEASSFRLPKMRPMTIGGLCIHIGISVRAFHTYADNDKYKDVIEEVKNVMATQKFEGAAADLLNANLIARDLGLSEKSDVTSGGERLDTWSVLPVTTKK